MNHLWIEKPQLIEMKEVSSEISWKVVLVQINLCDNSVCPLGILSFEVFMKNTEQAQGDERERHWTISGCPFDLVCMTLKFTYYLQSSLTVCLTLTPRNWPLQKSHLFIPGEMFLRYITKSKVSLNNVFLYQKYLFYCNSNQRSRWDCIMFFFF